MTKTKILLGLAIALIVLYGIFGINWNQVLKIVEIEPDELKVETFSDADIKITFNNIGDSDIENYKIIANTTHSSGKYIQTLDAKFAEIIGAGATEITTMTPVKILRTEGSEISYLLNLYLYANGEFQEKYQLPLTVVSTSSNFPPYSSESDDKSIVFVDLDLASIDLINNDGEKTIDFKIKQEKDGLFDNVRVVPFVENNRNGFIEIETLPVEKIFDFIGEDTKTYSMPIKALKSEGDQIKYRLQLVLLSNDIQMDTKMIDVIIKPS